MQPFFICVVGRATAPLIVKLRAITYIVTL